jgi:RNA polymerase sigma-70 factor (ECF subfamily)
MSDPTLKQRFEEIVLENADAAYNLARWLLHDESGAEDAVQEAAVRTLRYLRSHTVESPKAWFMAVVRNACIDWLHEHRRDKDDEAFDEHIHTDHEVYPGNLKIGEDPESEAMRKADARWLRQCIEHLPREFREVIVLRELEEMSYKEISVIIDAPIGTVMSRISRGRDLLQRSMVALRLRGHG